MLLTKMPNLAGSFCRNMYNALLRRLQLFLIFFEKGKQILREGKYALEYKHFWDGLTRSVFCGVALHGIWHFIYVSVYSNSNVLSFRDGTLGGPKLLFMLHSYSPTSFTL